MLLCHGRTDGWLAGSMFATEDDDDGAETSKLKLTACLTDCAQLSAAPDVLW